MAGNLNKDLENARQKVAQLVKDLEKITKKPAPTFDLNNLDQANAAISTLEKALDNARQKAAELEEGFGGIASAIGAALAEMSKTDSAVNRTVKSMRGISSITQDLANDQAGLIKLSVKELENKKRKLGVLTDEAKAQAAIVANEHEKLTLDKNGNKLSEHNLKQRLKSQGISMREFNSIQSIIAANKENFDILNKANDKLEEKLEAAKKHAKQFSDNMGLGGAAIDGLSTALDKLGLGKLSETLGLNEAKEKMEELAEENALKGTTDRMGVLKAGIKSMGKSFTKNLTDPAFLLVGFIKQLFDALKIADQGAGDLAKSFNMSYGEANATRQELTEIAAISGDVALNTKGLQESLIAVGNSLGSNASLNEKDLKTFTKLREQAGFTNDELVGIQKISLANGKSLEDNTKEILGGAKAHAAQKGLMINEKQILRDISKASDSIKLSFGNSADELARAAVEARSVGMNLEQADKIADSLLNFESSITAELEAELLLGKDINLEKARQAALNNDLATVAKEISSQIGSAAEFSKIGRIQQEALAKSVGMTRDELSKTLMDQEALTKLSAKEGESAQQAFNRLVKEVGMEEAKKRLGDDQLATQFEQQSVQERFQQGVMKLQELFIQLAEPILAVVSPIVDLLMPALALIPILLTPVVDLFRGISGILSGNLEQLDGFQIALGSIALVAGTVLAITKSIAIYNGIIKGLKVAQIALEAAGKAGILGTIGALATQLALQMGLMSAAMATNAAVTFGVGVAIAVAAAAAGYAAIKSLTKADDMISPGKGKGGYGDRTLFGPEGAIQLNNKDTVIAGTDLFADDMVSAPKEQIQVANSTAPPPAPKEEPAFDSMKFVGEQISTFKDKLQVTTMVGIQ